MRSLATISALCASAAAQQPAVDDAQSYHQALEANPRSSIAHFRLGQILRQQKDPQGAAVEFTRALEGDREPSWTVVWSYINLGKILQTTDPGRARQQFVLAVETGDNTAGAADEAASLLRNGPNAPVADPASAAADRTHNPVIGPMAIEKVAAPYSPEGLMAEFEGTAIVTGLIEADGSAREMRVTRSVGLGLDEKALEAVAKWRFRPATSAGWGVPAFASFAVDFRLPAKQSRWHLTEATFHVPAGASRPVFASAFYPLGDGVSANAIEEGQLVGAFGRTATATIQFDIDEHGVPVNLEVEKSSADVWGPEAIRIVRAWRFKPGTKDGKPVVVPAAFAFAWGQKQLPPSAEAEKPNLGDPLAPSTFDTHPPIVFQMAPDYPADARAAGIEGTVALSLVVDENGDPRNVRVSESPGHGLGEAALAAVSAWKFQPVILNGHAEAVASTVRVDFRLPK